MLCSKVTSFYRWKSCSVFSIQYSGWNVALFSLRGLNQYPEKKRTFGDFFTVCGSQIGSDACSFMCSCTLLFYLDIFIFDGISCNFWEGVEGAYVREINKFQIPSWRLKVSVKLIPRHFPERTCKSRVTSFPLPLQWQFPQQWNESCNECEFAKPPDIDR